MNVALYGPGAHRWAMTERGRSALCRESHALSIGPSRLSWDGAVLTVDFDEITAPRPSRLRGSIRLHPTGLNRRVFGLDPQGRHGWRPIAPRAQVEVALERPAGAWRGTGYFDGNAGSEPLEAAFRAWDWSRAHGRRDSWLFYDVQRRGGPGAPLGAHFAARFDRNGEMERIEPPPRVALPATLWRVARHVRADAGDGPTVRRTLEDTPFYARSLLDGRCGGEPAEIVHESLSLDRLRSPLVRAMLPFRMPRALW